MIRNNCLSSVQWTPKAMIKPPPLRWAYWKDSYGYGGIIYMYIEEIEEQPLCYL